MLRSSLPPEPVSRQAFIALGGMAALLLTLAPLTVLAALHLVRYPWALHVGVGSAALIGAGALWQDRSRLARVLVIVGLGLVPSVASDRLLASPALALTCIMVVGFVGWWLLDIPLARQAGLLDPTPSAETRKLAALRAASFVALFALAVGTNASVFADRSSRAAIAVTLAVAVMFITAWASTCGTRRTKQMLVVAGLVALVALTFGQGTVTLAGMSLLPGMAVLVAHGREQSAPAWLSSIIDHPARLVVSTFIALCLAGTGLLALPASATAGRSVGFLDAAFTATSAVCVTGLIVLDTPKDFTGFGQGIILALIQVGGLGIMTFYTVALQFLGRRLSLRHELTVAGAAGVEHPRSLYDSLRRVLIVTGIAELAGTVLLTVGFVAGGEAILPALWRGLFTSISAFCNAGFALQSDSLVPYQKNLLVIHTVALLIVTGGLSPFALVSVPRLLRRQQTPLQIKLVLLVSTLLLAFGTVAYAAIEWSDSLGHLSRWHRLHNAWFQSVTTRTAGFNSVDMSATREAARTLIIVLMLIGGSPGGTAGGIKTTTLAILILAVIAALRGRDHVVAFGRHIRPRSVYRGAAVATVGLLSAIAGIAAVQLTQEMPFDLGVFEVISAVCTVGLSLGGTAMLDEVGKVIVIFLMFAGRVGPLTLFLFLVDRRPEADWDYPEEQVDVG